jgi:CubicO group peptidase (beta-lactamase class C family)
MKYFQWLIFSILEDNISEPDTNPKNRSMKKVVTAAVLLFIILAHAAYSQLPDHLFIRIDSLVESRLSSVAPGGVVLIAKKGEVIYRKAFGVSDLRSKAPVQPGMIFRIGSISKQFTAVAILQLVEQGKIKLQDSIQVYVPDFPHKAYPITIENILTHSSGIINFQDIKNPAPEKVHEHYTPQQGVDYFKDEPLGFKPGTQFEYSNSNFFLLGYLIERVTGQSFGDYLKDHLIAPAALRHTFYLPVNPQIADLIQGYSRFDGKHWENAELQDPTIMYTAGGLATNADDLLKWHNALLAGKLIRTDLLAKAYTAFKIQKGVPQYGYGWFIKEIDGVKTVEHSGSTDGYQADEMWLPGADIFIATLFNGFENDMDWQLLTNDIARITLGHPLGATYQVSDDGLKELAGTYAVGTDHTMVITFRKHQLFVKAGNPKDRLPEVLLYAESPGHFYIKEASLKFVFSHDPVMHDYMLTTYNSAGKDADWKKVK